MTSSLGLGEEAVVFECGGQHLVGVLHAPPTPSEIGVVIVVGGPQYRVGSHRQFVLLARELCSAGFACLRFDYRGLGDSDGTLRGFEYVHEDILAAVDYLLNALPRVKRVVLWGLCDGATAAGFYAAHDARVAGLVLLNPWVRSSESLARSLLFHYYAQRIFDWQAWRKLLTSHVAAKAAIRSVLRIGRTVLASRAQESQSRMSAGAEKLPSPNVDDGAPLLPRLTRSLRRFPGAILVVLSGSDITANEFVEAERGNRRLKERLGAINVERRTLPSADHTFSRSEWRDGVANWTIAWLQRLMSGGGR